MHKRHRPHLLNKVGLPRSISQEVSSDLISYHLQFLEKLFQLLDPTQLRDTHLEVKAQKRRFDLKVQEAPY